MRKVFKYSIDSYKSTAIGARWKPDFILELPDGAEILRADMQHGIPTIWALVDPEMPRMCKRRFLLAGTGHAIDTDSLEHVSTFFDGGLVMHLFEMIPIGILHD